jgi:PleD family two-component response regulator
MHTMEHRPDVALLDIDLPGVDGLTAAAELARIDAVRTVAVGGRVFGPRISYPPSRADKDHPR